MAKGSYSIHSQISQRKIDMIFLETDLTEDDVPTIDKIETKKSLVILVSVFLCSLMAMIYVYTSFPELDE